MTLQRDVRCINPACGVISRAPAFSIRGFSNCPKCFWVLPDPWYLASARRAWRLRSWVPTLLSLGFLVWIAVIGVSAALQDSQPLPKVQKIACAPERRPPHGDWLVADQARRIAPFQINAPEGADYFVKLENAATSQSMFFYLYGGRHFQTDMPVGTFILKYATGATCCGFFDLFGAGTALSKGTTFLTFSENFDGVSGHEVTLTPVRYGNFRTVPIPRSEF